MLSGPTSSTILQLGQLIGQEETACQALLETVYEERRAIHTLAVTEFHGINCRRLAILETLQALASKRDLLVLQLSQAHNLPQSASTLHGIIDALKGTDTGKLRQQYNAFMATAKAVREQIKQNVVLIENIRGFVDKALSVGTTIIPGLELYTSTGQNRTAHTHAALIRQQG
jgi:hypothetical protein